MIRDWAAYKRLRLTKKEHGAVKKAVAAYKRVKSRIGRRRVAANKTEHQGDTAADILDTLFPKGRMSPEHQRRWAKLANIVIGIGEGRTDPYESEDEVLL